MKPDLRKGMRMWLVVCEEQGPLRAYKTRRDARIEKVACDRIVPVIVKLQRKK